MSGRRDVVESPLRLIVGYKLGKAVLQLVSNTLLLALLGAGLGEKIRVLLATVQANSTEGWSVALAASASRARGGSSCLG